MTVAAAPLSPVMVGTPASAGTRRTECALPDTSGSTLRLGDMLLSAGLLTDSELEAALEYQRRKGKRLGEALLELGLVSEEQLLPYLHRQLGMPAVRLRDGLVDPAVVRLIPRQAAERLSALAMFKVRGTLTVAMADPQDLLLTDEIEDLTGLRVRPVFAARSNIHRMLDRCYQDDFAVDTVTADLDESAVELRSDPVDMDVTSLENMADGSPVVNLINYLIMQAVRGGASDIHIEPGAKHSTVRFRVDGQLREVLRPRRDIHPALISRIKVMGRMDIAEQRYPQDGRCRVAVENREVDLRISTAPTVLGEKSVLRILDRKNLTFNLDELGFPRDLLSDVKRLLAKPYGLFLVCGPTGSGKTTTLYSALELIKSEHRNIVTVEDPVEYRVELVNQIQVNEAKGLDFPAVLRSILRQDPDVIMVGEIRDSETAKVAVQAALTGHLVLSTLHTNDSAGAIVRLVDMGIEPYKLAACVVGVCAQRLVRRVCRKCQTIYYPPAELLATLHCARSDAKVFVRGEGCSDCHDTGFLGRIGTYEVLVLDEAIRKLVAAGADTEALRAQFRASGGRTLLEEGIRLAEQHTTSLDEVMRVAYFD